MKRKFKIGDRVRVRGHRGVRTIAGVYSNIPGGVYLDEYVGDFRSWNVDSLVFVGRPKRRPGE